MLHAQMPNIYKKPRVVDTVVCCLDLSFGNRALLWAQGSLSLPHLPVIVAAGSSKFLSGNCSWPKRGTSTKVMFPLSVCVCDWEEAA